ncbi:dimethylarginine dimethylaminohydrolase family protein [Clostridium chrysemydis]|uniref:dimethylarginine dimethylaminohydrolase family protein n=1 Tax=Clostridium chrysemydis TaxID=2665504 RepID=UPI001883D5F6|nr:arginine deiminase family protein [Clostridium chrysemydis]
MFYKEILLCYPVNYDIDSKNINKELMYSQYNSLINMLISNKVNIRFLEPIYGKSQVYTRDLAFQIEDIFFVSNMKSEDRKEEVKTIENYFKDKKIKYYKMKNNIEGGDVIHYKNTVLVGMSNRTTRSAVEELKKYLEFLKKDIDIIKIEFEKDKLIHLDCVFNIVNPETCVVSEYVYNIEEIKKLFKKVIVINKKETLDLGTNFITINDNIILTSNKEIHKTLLKENLNTIYLDYSEFVKGGGSFNCTTLPLLIKKEN